MISYFSYFVVDSELIRFLFAPKFDKPTCKGKTFFREKQNLSHFLFDEGKLYIPFPFF